MTKIIKFLSLKYYRSFILVLIESILDNSFSICVYKSIKSTVVLDISLVNIISIKILSY